MVSTHKHKQLIVHRGRERGNVLFAKPPDAPDDKFYCFATGAPGLKDCIGKYLPEVRRIMHGRGYKIASRPYERLKAPLSEIADTKSSTH